ncbi:MAG: hemerythrin domain-containing protein [Ignavibacteria bacterium]|nr:hemerythrin domain-containing protein [Ignavibacteria bacterium]
MKRFEQLYYLSWDHRSALMEAFNVSKYVDEFDNLQTLEKRNSIINFYEKDLLLHFRAEEEILLPRMTLNSEVNIELIRKTLDDHILIHSLIILLKKETNDFQKLKSILKEFATNLTAHIRFEERELFEHAQSILNNNDFNEIQKEITERYGDKYLSPSCDLPEELA